MSQLEDHAIIEVIDDTNNPPHNGRPITKMAISPESNYVLTYSLKDESFVGWRVNDDEIFKDTTTEASFPDIYDFKISDDKVILYDDSDLGET